MVSKLFSTYLLVITGQAEMPTLYFGFEIGNERMAKGYAMSASRKIASDRYYHFALFIQIDDQQTLIAEWNVKLEPVVSEIDHSQEITT